MNQFFNFLFVARKDGDTAHIISEIERNKLYKVAMVETVEECMERLRRGNLHCLLFNFEELSQERLKLLTSIRDAGFIYPTVVFADLTGRDLLDRAQRMTRVVVVEKPFEPKDVWGICQKFLQGQRVYQRVFRRYYTSQPAAFEKTVTGETLTGQIFNMSRGGAYVELGSGKVSPGDMIRVSIPLDKLARNYSVDAEVIWCTPFGYAKGWPAAGLRFIKTGEVYRNLLNKL